MQEAWLLHEWALFFTPARRDEKNAQLDDLAPIMIRTWVVLQSNHHYRKYAYFTEYFLTERSMLWRSAVSPDISWQPQ
jgi:hypothetical protein